MEEQCFRVLLDLSELSFKSYKYVWMSISPRELKLIADLKNAILRKLCFERSDIKLFLRDGLLLDDEKVLILRENDTIKVQYEDNSPEQHNTTITVTKLTTSNVSPYENNSFGSNRSQEETVKVAKKRKRRTSSQNVSEASHDVTYVTESNSEALSSERGNKKSKKLKKSHSTPITENDSDVFAEIPESPPVEVFEDSATNEVDITSDIKQNIEDPTPMDNNNYENTDLGKQSVSSCKKKKRKRHKKRKEMPVSPFDFDEELSAAPMTQTTCITDGGNFTGIRKHILFTDNGYNDDSILLNRSGQNGLENTVSRIANNSEEWVTTPLEEDSYSTSRIISPRNDAKYWTAPPARHKSTDDAKTSKSSEMKIKNYKDYPDLKTFPSVGTHIAFKILELDEKYSPVVSEYREGIVRSTDSAKNELNIELIQKIVKPGRTGRFEILIPGEIPPDEEIESVNTCWTSLIEPKLIV